MTHHLLGILVSEQPALAPAIGEMTEWLAHPKREAAPQVAKLLDQLDKNTPFWQ